VRKEAVGVNCQLSTALLHKSNFSTRCCGQAYSKSASHRFMQQRHYQLSTFINCQRLTVSSQSILHSALSILYSLPDQDGECAFLILHGRSAERQLIA
jgi:hypothetical protein